MSNSSLQFVAGAISLLCAFYDPAYAASERDNPHGESSRALWNRVAEKENDHPADLEALAGVVDTIKEILASDEPSPEHLAVLIDVASYKNLSKMSTLFLDLLVDREKEVVPLLTEGHHDIFTNAFNDVLGWKAKVERNPKAKLGKLDAKEYFKLLKPKELSPEYLAAAKKSREDRAKRREAQQKHLDALKAREIQPIADRLLGKLEMVLPLPQEVEILKEYTQTVHELVRQRQAIDAQLADLTKLDYMLRFLEQAKTTLQGYRQEHQVNPEGRKEDIKSLLEIIKELEVNIRRRKAVRLKQESAKRDRPDPARGEESEPADMPCRRATEDEAKQIRSFLGTIKKLIQEEKFFDLAKDHAKLGPHEKTASKLVQIAKILASSQEQHLKLIEALSGEDNWFTLSPTAAVLVAPREKWPALQSRFFELEREQSGDGNWRFIDGNMIPKSRLKGIEIR